jgi:hypothetical protein
MAQLDLNSIYQYYIDQGATPTEAAQYTVYYIPYGQKKSFTGINTQKFKTSGQFESEYAPNYTKFKASTEPFWKQVVDTVDKGGTYLDLQKIVYSSDGKDYASNLGLLPQELLTNAGKILNEKTAVIKAKAKQDKSLDFYASSIGAPSTKAKYGLVADKANNIVVFKPAADIYAKATADFRTKLRAAKVDPTKAADYIKQFDTAIKSGLEQAIAKSNRNPFVDAAISKAGK